MGESKEPHKDIGTHQSNHLDTALLKFTLHLSEGAQLGRANGGEVGRVGEEDGPAVADELVEVNLALGGQRLEVGGYRNVVSIISTAGVFSIDPYRLTPDAGAAVPGKVRQRSGERLAELEAAEPRDWPMELPWVQP